VEAQSIFVFSSNFQLIFTSWFSSPITSFIALGISIDMAGKSMRKATDMSRPEKTKEEWETVKSDTFRIYIQEKKTLKVTMAAIEKKYQFKQWYTANPPRNPETNILFSTRIWRYKLKEWGYSKHKPAEDMKFMVAKGKERALAGKDTIFYRGGTKVTADEIKNFKRRKVGEAPSNIGELLLYSTPSNHVS
jgi:hypothetical protein